ncbi:MAG: hypothetical protein ACR2KZ_02610 [Segetibacter sp.]
MRIRLQPIWVPALSILFVAASCGGNKDSKAGATAGPGGAPANQIKDYPVLTITPHSTTLFSDFPATVQGQQNIRDSSQN